VPSKSTISGVMTAILICARVIFVQRPVVD
jgi:hypothetical protein